MFLSEHILFAIASLLPHKYTFLLIVPLTHQVSSRVNNHNTQRECLFILISLAYE